MRLPALAVLTALLLAPSLVSARGGKIHATTQYDEVSRSVAVAAGSRNRIWWGFGILPDCEVMRGWSVTIDEPPRNGTTSLKRSNARIDANWATRPHMAPRQSQIAQDCIGRDTLVITVDYLPKPGFRGQDSLSFIVRSGDDRFTRRHRMTIQVD